VLRRICSPQAVVLSVAAIRIRIRRRDILVMNLSSALFNPGIIVSGEIGAMALCPVGKGSPVRHRSDLP